VARVRETVVERTQSQPEPTAPLTLRSQDKRSLAAGLGFWANPQRKRRRARKRLVGAGRRGVKSRASALRGLRHPPKGSATSLAVLVGTRPRRRRPLGRARDRAVRGFGRGPERGQRSGAAGGGRRLGQHAAKQPVAAPAERHQTRPRLAGQARPRERLHRLFVALPRELALTDVLVRLTEVEQIDDQRGVV